jgi:DNA-directed RNA polymerase subunit RPC12/RpoP
MVSPGDASPTALKCPQCGASIQPGEASYLICQYCGSSIVWNPPQTETSNQTQEAFVRGMRLRQFSYTDTQGTGLELFRMLVPVDWEFHGGCQWLLDNPGMPATVAFQLWNPNGAEMFEVLPNMNFTWTTNPLIRGLHPIGSRYFGAEVRPPMSIQEAFQQFVLPRYRAGVQNLKVIKLEDKPELPNLVKSEAPISGGSAEGASARIQFTWQNVAYEEEIFGVVEVFRSPIASMFGTAEVLFWFVDYLFAFRTAPDRLEATADLFGLMIRSFQLNPQWYAAYKTIIQQLAQQQIQRIHHIGQISQILSQTSAQIREQNLNDWYDRQQVYERLATDHSRVIRGVDAFYDPHREEVVELPSGYGHAWANNLGEYIITEDPNFNPNIHSNLHWESMQQQ